jgi:hypothetical protein
MATSTIQQSVEARMSAGRLPDIEFESAPEHSSPRALRRHMAGIRPNSWLADE